MNIESSILAFLISACCLAYSPVARADAETIHTYSKSRAHEIDNAIAVDLSKLSPLVPPGYAIIPAANLGLGGFDQGIVVIANF
jgi:hypothetical protein